MTESNTNDRRFWMVISKIVNVDTGISSFEVLKDTSGSAMFADSNAADILACECSEMIGGDEVFVVEAVSRYTIPAPRVVRKNLHIPPVTAREDNKND